MAAAPNVYLSNQSVAAAGPDFEAAALERNLNQVATRKTLQLTSIFHPTNGKHTRHMCVCISFVFCNLCVLYLYCAAFTDFEATIR